MRKVLIVANQTASGAHLRERVRDELARGPVHFTLLVPAVAGLQDDALTWDEHRTWDEAQSRMETAAAAMRECGAEVDGRVGSHDAMAAVRDVLRETSFDEIWVSTLPAGISRWIGMDLPSRIEREAGVRVVHLPVEREPAGV